MASNEECGIRVENAYKRYSKKIPNVLDNLCMTVPKCSIYSLLGASGCGKTTLLSCIIGQNVLNFGKISLNIKTKRQLGYMPQQISLYPEFTIAEMLYYYGLLYDLSNEKIQEKMKYLQVLLHLNHLKRICGSLSGGQQRRVSLAITLLHDPELLILDEPTSGIDPIIAEEIWSHLLLLAQNGRTILITTHYIDEAKRSHMIGLMRKGVLLEESPPLFLLDKYKVNCLEDVFLLLSSQQQQQRKIEHKRKSIGVDNVKSHSKIEGELSMPPKGVRSLPSKEYIRGSRLRAHLWKHLVWMRGNPQVLAVTLLIPVLSVLFFNWAVGHVPEKMPMGVINQEANLSYCQTFPGVQTFNCTYKEQYSCLYLQKLTEQQVELIEYFDVETARESAKRNHIWGFMSIPQNFTQGLESRLTNSWDMEYDEVDMTEVLVGLDKSNYIISNEIKRGAQRAFRKFLLSYAETCNYDTRLSNMPPISFSYLFGKEENTFDNFAAPALMTLVMFYMPFLFTTSALIMEKSKGIIERSIIAGMTVLEVVASQLIVQFALILFQTVLALLLNYGAFTHPLVGNPYLVFLLLILQGIVGTFLGLLTTFVCNSDTAAGLFIIGTSVPLLFLSGFIWPINGMQEYCKYFAELLPLTYPIISYRSIAFRGYSFLHWKVYYGFIASSAWIVGLVTLCCLLLKNKSSLV